MAKVIVIDDRVTNRNILTRLALSVEEGLQVQSFASPVDALSRLHGAPVPDLVITDYNMPEMDGAAFIRTLRDEAGFADVPIIVVTVYEDRDFCYRALEAGATDFLLSPVDHLEFRARARNLLTMRRQQKLLAERAAELERALRERGSGLADTPSDMQAFLDSMPVPINAVDRHGRLIAINAAHERLYNLDRKAALGRNMTSVYGEQHATRHTVLNEKVLESRRPLATPTCETLGDGSERREIVSVKGLFGEGPSRDDSVLTASLEITDLVTREPQGVSATRTDALTQVATAEAFEDRADLELARARRQSEILAIHIVDIDRLKGINDAFGRIFGDELLRSVAGRLSARLRETDSIARLRSDEFAILQLGLKRPDDAAELAHRLGEAFADPFLINQEEVHISASIGITLFPRRRAQRRDSAQERRARRLSRQGLWARRIPVLRRRDEHRRTPRGDTRAGATPGARCRAVPCLLSASD